MAVDKILELDLSNLTPEGLQMIDKQFGEIEDKLKKSGKKPNAQRIKKQAQNIKEKIFPRKVLTNILKLQNPTAFLTSNLLKMLPALGAILAVTGVFVALTKKVDDFQKKFVDSVDDRIDLFRNKQQQALIQAGLAQAIFTTSAGGTEPRDAYNTFEQFNNNQAAIERDFALTNISGVD